jgi:hypothetical protein
LGVSRSGFHACQAVCPVTGRLPMPRYSVQVPIAVTAATVVNTFTGLKATFISSFLQFHI